jgi:hypothetical protein
VALCAWLWVLQPNWEVPVKKKKGRRGDVSSDDEKDDGARNKASDESKRRMTHKEKESERCKHTGKALPKPERHVQRMKGSGVSKFPKVVHSPALFSPRANLWTKLVKLTHGDVFTQLGNP